MDNCDFSKSFCFAEYKRPDGSHTDNSGGASIHYFGYILNGSARFVSGDSDFTVNQGELVYIPKHLPYHSYWYGFPKSHFVSLGFSVFPDTQFRKFSLQRIVPDQATAQLIRSMELNTAATCTSVGAFYSIMGQLLPKMEYTSIIQKATASAVTKAIKFMQADPHMPISEIAHNLGISESGLYAEFRTQGTTPVNMRNRMLCEKAINLLLSTDMTVDAISDFLGFSTPAYFRKVLKKYYDKTPSQIRKGLLI